MVTRRHVGGSLEAGGPGGGDRPVAGRQADGTEGASLEGQAARKHQIIIHSSWGSLHQLPFTWREASEAHLLQL